MDKTAHGNEQKPLGERLRRAAIVRLSLVRRIYALDLLWRATRSFLDNQSTIFAAAVSYYVLFSFVPLLILLVSILGVLVQDPAVRVRVTDTILAQIPDVLAVREQVETLLQDAATHTGAYSVIGLLGLAWTGSGAFGAMRRALNVAFGVSTRRPFLYGRAIDLVAMIAVGTLLVLSTLMTLGLGLLRNIAGDDFYGINLDSGWTLLFFLVSLITSFLVFLLLYRLAPNLRAHFRDLWPGALIAAIGFEVIKVGFSFYITEFGSYQTIYGPLGGVVTFLLFVFLAANIIIFAASVAAERVKEHSADYLEP